MFFANVHVLHICLCSTLDMFNNFQRNIFVRQVNLLGGGCYTGQVRDISFQELFHGNVLRSAGLTIGQAANLLGSQTFYRATRMQSTRSGAAGQPDY